jgi:carboxyl-terminal processing protease
MNSKPVKVVVGLALVLILMAGSFGSGFFTGNLYTLSASSLHPATSTPTAVSPSPEPTQGGTPQDLQTLFKPFWETWQILHDKYVDQPLDNVSLMRGAIGGMMNSLGDQHSGYMTPQEYSDANVSINGKYTGIGAWVDSTGDYLVIVSPMKGFPAQKAGLQPGDEIRAVDGVDMTGINPELVRLKVIGPAGSSVHLSIFRTGQDKLLEFDIVRENIVIPSVTGEIIHDNIAYVTITTFGDTTATDLHKILGEVMAKNPKGLILDLRNNGGGYLNTAIDVASEFISSGVIVYEQYGDGTRQTFEAKPDGLATDIPMVVLVNEGSASASEIVAGAIQDQGRGKLVGVKTYGKGSVQQWIPLTDDQGAVRVTVAKWLTPNNLTIHKVGLTPDVIVERTSDDYKTGKDPQLDAAINLLLNQ